MEDKSFWEKQELICDCDDETSSPVTKNKVQALRKDSTEGKMSNSPMKNKGNVTSKGKTNFFPKPSISCSKFEDTKLNQKRRVLEERYRSETTKASAVVPSFKEVSRRKVQANKSSSFVHTSEERRSMSREIKELLQQLVSQRKASDGDKARRYHQKLYFESSAEMRPCKENMGINTPFKNLFQGKEKKSKDAFADLELAAPSSNPQGDGDIFITMQDI